MEINIDNAFIIAIKLTIGPCLVQYSNITETTLHFSYHVINYFLKKPLLTTLLGFVFMLLILTTLLIAFITLIGVLIFVILIILIEGVVIITCLTMVFIVLNSFITIIIALSEIKYSILRK